MARKKNPFAKGPTLPKTEIPKGLKSGDAFRRGNRYYLVISYRSATGKLVRYARPYKGLTAAARAVSGTPRQAPKRKALRKTAKRVVRKKNPVAKSNPRGMGCKGFAKGKHVAPPKGAARGKIFKRGGKHYMVVKNDGKRQGKPVRVRKCDLRRRR